MSNFPVVMAVATKDQALVPAISKFMEPITMGVDSVEHKGHKRN